MTPHRTTSGFAPIVMAAASTPASPPTMLLCNLNVAPSVAAVAAFRVNSIPHSKSALRGGFFLPLLLICYNSGMHLKKSRKE